LKKRCLECGATEGVPNSKRKNGGPWRVDPLTNDYPLCSNCWTKRGRKCQPLTARQLQAAITSITYIRKIRIPATLSVESIERWQKKHGKKISTQQYGTRTENKEKLFSHFSKGKPKCACCGVKGTDFLTVDHIIPRKKMGKYKKLKKLGFKEKMKTDYLVGWLLKNIDNKFVLKYFQILCWNCNRGKFLEGICPHKIKDYWQTVLLRL